MPTIRPVKPDHSVNEVAFVLNFAKPFSEKDILAIAQLEDNLINDFPKMERHEGAGVKISSNGSFEPQPSRLLSIAFKHLDGQGEFDWALRIENQFIVVNCLDYTGGWKTIWPKVHGFLKTTANKLISPENPIESVALQYIDRFIYEGQVDSYSSRTIFNDESEYLTKKSTKAGPLWHVHQGWFDYDKGLPIRILNVLNITAAIADKEHHTTIDHSATIQFKKKVTNHKTLFMELINEELAINYYFNKLHNANKDILQGLLNDDRISDINLI